MIIKEEKERRKRKKNYKSMKNIFIYLSVTGSHIIVLLY
jgi:hypothetical protein